MSKSQINPTRMELIKLKNKLKMSIRGHKLLKDKQDELVHTFIKLVYETRNKRVEVDQLFSDALTVFNDMKEQMALAPIYEMLMIPSSNLNIKYAYKSIMTVEIPKIDLNINISNEQTYSDITSPIEIDTVKDKMNLVFPKLIELSEMEQSINLLSEEIAKTRRRVNVIENIMIPELKEDIKRITMKLEDNERSNTVRIMKSKDIVLEKIAKEREKRNQKNSD
ncbi:V-type ATP synthase subunit D [Haploplasma axanthum]|uniref:V-type ATP synthase subunit D n=1 Tax=Haploplasma axanthum TaxID=29552 RepID=A0A449BCI6_HAPAX|nr:V-type ATP synthase subunit D [Haploplasma axanthum]VEU80145.1 V-type sodium pump subunit D [Haploplasma axanthum]